MPDWLHFKPSLKQKVQRKPSPWRWKGLNIHPHLCCAGKDCSPPMHLPLRVSRYNNSQHRRVDQIILRASENIWGFSRQAAVCTESRRDCLCVLLFKVNFLLFLISYRADGPRWSKGQGHAAWQFYLAVSHQANNVEDTPAFVLLGERYNARTSVTRFIRLIRSCMYWSDPWKMSGPECREVGHPDQYRRHALQDQCFRNSSQKNKRFYFDFTGIIPDLSYCKYIQGLFLLFVTKITEFCGPLSLFTFGEPKNRYSKWGKNYFFIQSHAVLDCMHAVGVYKLLQRKITLCKQHMH